MKSGSRIIYVLLILSFSVYRCHGNIDFTENYIKTNCNPKPITGVNFTSIRLRENFLKSPLKKLGMVSKKQACVNVPRFTYKGKIA